MKTPRTFARSRRARALLACVALSLGPACGASSATPASPAPATAPGGAPAAEGDETASGDVAAEEDPGEAEAREKAKRDARRAKLRPTDWKIRAPKKVSALAGKAPVGISEYDSDSSDETFANDDARFQREMESLLFSWATDEAAETIGAKRAESGGAIGCGVGGLYTAYTKGGGTLKIGFDRPIPVANECEPVMTNDEGAFGPNDVHAYDAAADVAVWVRAEGNATKADAQKLFDAVFTK